MRGVQVEEMMKKIFARASLRYNVLMGFIDPKIVASVTERRLDEYGFPLGF